MAVIGLLLLFVFATPANANINIDARFDKTGDGIVDAADWKMLTQEEKTQYARASIQALGEDPDVRLPDGMTRQEHYLKGLNEVYR